MTYSSSGAASQNITNEAIDYFVVSTKKQIQEVALHYGLAEKDIPDRIWRKVGRLQEEAVTLADAQSFSARAVQSMRLHCLDLWAKHKIDGPTSVASLIKKAKAAESLSRSLLKQSDETNCAKKKQKLVEQSERQVERAKQLREQADLLQRSESSPKSEI
jgi:hypothetical protein